MWFATSLKGDDDDDDGDDDGASNGFVMLHVTKGQIQNGSMLGGSLTFSRPFWLACFYVTAFCYFVFLFFTLLAASFAKAFSHRAKHTKHKPHLVFDVCFALHREQHR